jgi:hypothetical protein
MNNFDRTCVDDALLLLALDQELAPRRAWRIRLHLDHCERCRTRLEEMRRITSQVGELYQVVLPPDDVRSFAARLELETAREQPARSRTRWFTPPQQLRKQLAWCGALALVVLLGLKLWTRQPPVTAMRIVQSPQTAVVPAVPKLIAARRAPAKTMRHAHGMVKKQAPPAAVAFKEVATPFFPLPFSDAALPLEQASVMRVDLPRSALELAGLPVEEARRNERIRADLVLGADGLARAIRFVR